MVGIASYNQNPGIVCGYLNALATWIPGYLTQAATAMDRTVSHARELRHPFSLGMSLLFSAQLAQLRRDPETSLAHADEALEVSSEHRLHAVELWCSLPRGWALVQQGETAAGIADIREAMDRRRRMGMGAVWPWFLALYADAAPHSGSSMKVCTHSTTRRCGCSATMSGSTRLRCTESAAICFYVSTTRMLLRRNVFSKRR